MKDSSVAKGLGDRFVAVGLITFVVFIHVHTASFPQLSHQMDPGPGGFPRVVATLIGVLALGLLIKPRQWERFPRGSGILRVVGTIILVFMYYLAIQPLGFVITTAGFLISETLLIGVRKLISTIIVTLIGSIGLFYLFRYVLEVPLPTSGIGALPF